MAAGDQHIQKALEADQARDYLTVIEEIEAGLKKPIRIYEMALVYAALAHAYAQVDRFDRALEAHEESIKANSKSAVAWRYYGITLRKLNRYDEAESCYEKALAIDPRDDLTRASLGALYIFRDKPMPAIEMLEESTEEGSQSGIAYGNLALAYGKVGRFAEAQEALAVAISRGYHNWRDVQQRLRDMEEFLSGISPQDPVWLPAQCPNCQAPTAVDTVQWLSGRSAKCGYCGVNLKAGD